MCLPLLDLVETLEKGNGHEDHNSLLSMTNFDLSSTSVQVDPPLANPYLPSCCGKRQKGRLGVSSSLRCRFSRNQAEYWRGVVITSLAEVNCRGRRAALRSVTEDSRSNRA